MIDRRELDTLLRSDPAALVQRCQLVIDSPLYSLDDRIYARIRMARGLALIGRSVDGAKISNVAYEEAVGLDNIEIKMLACSEQGVQSYFAEDFLAALKWHEAALDLARQASIDDTRYARLLVNKANALTRLNANVEAIECYSAALDIARRLNDKQLMATLLGNLAVVTLHLQDEPVREREYLEEALAIFRELGDRVGEINSLTTLAVWHRTHGSVSDAAEIFKDIAKLCSGDAIPMSVSTLFHMLITHCLLNDVESANKCLVSMAEIATTQSRWEVQAELAIARGLVAKLENRLTDCIEAYETAYEIYRQHDHLRQAEDVLRQLLPCLEQYGDATKLCHCYRLLQKLRASTRAIESEHSLNVLAVKHARETMRQQAELDRLKNIDLVRAHDELLRTTFDLDRLIENCAVRLSMPLEMITEILSDAASSELTTEMLEEIRGVFDQLLSDVGEILTKDTQDVENASLQSLEGVIAFVKAEADMRLMKRGSTGRWSIKAEDNEYCSLAAAKFHSMVMRVIDMMHTAVVGSIHLDVIIQRSSGQDLEMIARGFGTTVLPYEDLLKVFTTSVIQPLKSTTSSVRTIRMAWLAVQYSAQRLGAICLDVRGNFGNLDLRVVVPDHGRRSDSALTL